MSRISMLLRLRRPMAKLKSHLNMLNVLRFVWLLIVWTNEVGMFRVIVSRCTWPTMSSSQVQHATAVTYNLNDRTSTPPPTTTHVLLIADPQLLDLNSYPDRSRWLQVLSQHIVDLNLRKSWHAVVSKLNPDVVVFLGDMMDNGRSVNDYEFEQYYSRFKSIFKFPRSIPVHYIPGNHDVGLGPSSDPLIKAHVRSRYLPKFGPQFNYDFKVSNHTFLFIDAPSLVDEFEVAVQSGLEWVAIQGETIEYLQSFYEARLSEPIVLFSHIPLARSNFTKGSCGPFRENVRPILPGRGQSYQNLLPKEVTLYLLNDIRPSVIFSGDDHDYCDYRHTLLDKSQVHEVSVRSFSMAMGIKRPGFQLLSIAPPLQPESQPEHEHEPENSSSPSLLLPNFVYKPCLLPNQINIYIFQYGFFLFLTIVMLCSVNLSLSFGYYYHHPPSRRQPWRRWRTNSNTTQTQNPRVFTSIEPSDDDVELEFGSISMHPAAAAAGNFSGVSSEVTSDSMSQRLLPGNNDNGADRSSNEEDSESGRSQLTLLPLHFTTTTTSKTPTPAGSEGHHPGHSHSHIPYEPSLISTRQRRRMRRRLTRKWYSQVYFDFVHISWPSLLLYVFVTFWYFL